MCGGGGGGGGVAVKMEIFSWNNFYNFLITAAFIGLAGNFVMPLVLKVVQMKNHLNVDHHIHSNQRNCPNKYTLQKNLCISESCHADLPEFHTTFATIIP